MIRKPVFSTQEIFRIPLLVGIVSGVGLTAALLGDGVWDVVSWIALGIPVLVCAYCWHRRGGQSG